MKKQEAIVKSIDIDNISCQQIKHDMKTEQHAKTSWLVYRFSKQ
jgi:hypothetical protein